MAKRVSKFSKGNVALGDDAASPTFARGYIDPATGIPTLSATSALNNDIVLTTKTITESVADGGALTPRGDFIAERVWNSVWNDVADFQLLNDQLVYGKCYIDTIEGAQIAYERCQLSVIGLASDTFGFAVGSAPEQNQVPIAVCGWVLAFVDKEYPCGTPLTNDENGNLTEMTLEEKRNYPERILGIYKKKEHDDFFGTEQSQIKVNGRHWIKVK